MMTRLNTQTNWQEEDELKINKGAIVLRESGQKENAVRDRVRERPVDQNHELCLNNPLEEFAKDGKAPWDYREKGKYLFREKVEDLVNERIKVYVMESENGQSIKILSCVQIIFWRSMRRMARPNPQTN